MDDQEQKFGFSEGLGVDETQVGGWLVGAAPHSAYSKAIQVCRESAGRFRGMVESPALANG